MALSSLRSSLAAPRLVTLSRHARRSMKLRVAAIGNGVGREMGLHVPSVFASLFLKGCGASPGLPAPWPA